VIWAKSRHSPVDLPRRQRAALVGRSLGRERHSFAFLLKMQRRRDLDPPSPPCLRAVRALGGGIRPHQRYDPAAMLNAILTHRRGDPVNVAGVFHAGGNQAARRRGSGNAREHRRPAGELAIEHGQRSLVAPQQPLLL